MCGMFYRQSYDVELELTIPGTNTKSTNTLDLKNPFFRYTGQQPAAPPGTNSTSPSDAYWTVSQDPNAAGMRFDNRMMNSRLVTMFEDAKKV